ncbi:hypothetical protein IAQ61_011069 [Plenodomus lingam]|uniref:uncharacterized protein n=1 Tax=Leptosphaeria maculans TaxID=5022 RepID=UPI003334A73F|nr:hypothetical protein IAQ61_011069 [Plenodomus lingam]
MARYTDADSDAQRLPEGFHRIGFDADTSIYTFSGPDGKLYESEPGNRYGELYPVGEPRPQRSEADIEAVNAAIEEDHASAVRTMLPLLTVLKAVIRFKSGKAKPENRTRRDSVESFLKPEKGRLDSVVEREKNKDFG